MSRSPRSVVAAVIPPLVFGVGFLLIPFTGDGLHDRIAGTRVVRREGD